MSHLVRVWPYHKHYVRLERFVRDKNSGLYGPEKPFQPSTIYMGMATSLPKCSIWLGSCLTLKHYVRLERLVRDKSSTLFGPDKLFLHCTIYMGKATSLPNCPN